MNTQNYASLEACKRLLDAGIVLETDAYWRPYEYPDRREWKLYLFGLHHVKEIPAPCFAEVWRELPEQYDGEYLRVIKDDGKTFCDYGEYADRYCNINSTDALIDLLIWVKGAKK